LIIPLLLLTTSTMKPNNHILSDFFLQYSTCATCRIKRKLPTCSN